MRSLLLMLALFPLFTGCAGMVTSPNGLVLMNHAQFESVVERYTDRTQRYEGLYNTLDVAATIRNTAVMRGQLESQARIYQWDRVKFQSESNKLAEKARNETEVFLSFYTPERKNDDLSRGNTQWRIYLEVDGRRFEGKASRIKTGTAEVQGFYPYHTRFATPYSVIFPVSVTQIEVKPMKFTVTGPMGMAALNFAQLAAAESTLSTSPQTSK